ncbi:Uncharacterised protein [Actinobacillus pleuropneumoniae]|nr:Uncharacterised protein [Actinobacillus pleuropneumoniae]
MFMKKLTALSVTLTLTASFTISSLALQPASADAASARNGYRSPNGRPITAKR